MKLLIAIASYGEKNDNFLNISLQEFRKIPYQKNIIVQSNINKNLGHDIQCIVGQPNIDPRSLVFAHRQLFIDNLNNYDLFLYTEDDILITQHHIKAFLEINDILSEDQVPGFVRYEVDQNNEILLTDIHYSYHWLSKSVRRIQSNLFAELNNRHSACYLLTKSQLSIVIKSGNYNNFPRISAGGGILEAASADPFIDCGLEKVICLSDIDRFLVHHLPNNYIHRWGLSMAHLNLQIAAMNEIADKSLMNNCLIEDKTKLLIRNLDKKFYPPFDQNILDKIGAGHQKILSVGCGNGSTEEKLLQMGHEVTVIPLDSIIAAMARKKGIEVTLPNLEQSLTMLSSRKFDCILFLETLHYVADPEKYLKTFLGLLGHKGKIIATFMNISLNRYSQLINSDHYNFTCEKNSNNYTNDNYDQFEFSGFNFINHRSVINNWFTNAGLNINQTIYYPLSWKKRLISIFSKEKTFAKAKMFMIVARTKV